MLKKYRVKFKVNDSFWLSPGRIIFSEESFELSFLGKRKLLIDYLQIIGIKKSRYFLDKCLIVSTKDYNISLIPGFKFEKLIVQFNNLGFSIEN
ncbi:MAG: hypothetical protein M0R05_05925 [Bacilli bacterium]|nr:hypothetical protein [Bacilli bacterium]MDD4077195.1 hypothetical protein [Bacilli bacterium]MDD4388185.1 hypothetical protein [Bacilli bacterium]